MRTLDWIALWVASDPRDFVTAILDEIFTDAGPLVTGRAGNDDVLSHLSNIFE